MQLQTDRQKLKPVSCATYMAPQKRDGYASERKTVKVRLPPMFICYAIDSFETLH